MINISDGLKALIKQGSADTMIKIECGNFIFGYDDKTAVNDNKVLELSVNRIASYDDYPLGNAYSCYANVTLWDIPTNAVLKGQRTSIYAGYMVNGSVEWVPLGVYYPEKPTRSGQSLSFTAYDKMHSLSFAYVPSISGNQSPITILQDLARVGGFELDESVHTVAAGSWDNIPLSLLYGMENDENTSYSVCDCISYIAGYLGANALFNRYGKLELYRFADKSDENGIKYVIDDDCVCDVVVDESDSKIEYITCNHGNGEITSSPQQMSADTKGILIENPLITNQSQLDKIRNTVLNNGAFLYRALSLKHLRGNPAWECFDVITYIDDDNNSYNFPLMAIEIIYDGSIVCNLQSFSKSKEEQNHSGSILNRIIASHISEQTKFLADRIHDATESITTAIGGLVALVDLDGDGIPDNLIAGEHKVDLASGSKWRTQGRCVRINQNGIAVSTTGANGPFVDFAVYYDKTLNRYLVNANDIAVGTLSGIEIIADKGTIGSWNINENSIDKMVQLPEYDSAGNPTGSVPMFKTMMNVPTDDGNILPPPTFAVEQYDFDGKEWVHSDWMYFVRANGFLYAKNAEIHGTIYADSGVFTGIINATRLKAKKDYWVTDNDFNNDIKVITSISDSSSDGRIDVGRCSKVDGFYQYNFISFEDQSDYRYIYAHCDAFVAEVGQQSDMRLKTDILPIDDYECFFNNLKPCKFKMKNGRSNRYHLGFIAQEVKTALKDAGFDTNAFAGYVETQITDDESGVEKPLILRYQEFIALNTMMIQKQQKRIDEQQQEIDSLKEQLSEILKRLEESD